MSSRRYQVGDVARMAGVSARTLRHYESIGLLTPSARTQAGYRLYTDSDLLRLQQIVIERQLGLALEEIRRLLDDPRIDRRQVLRRQRAQLLAQHQQTEKMLRSVDVALAVLEQSAESGATMVDMRQIFEGFDPAQHDREASQRWGHTDAYRESARRARTYTAEDWRRFKSELEAIMQGAAAALFDQRAPGDVASMDLAERHRQMIDRWFYPCSPGMHAALADLFEADARFVRNIDRYAQGLTPFWSAAIRANSARMAADGERGDTPG